MANDELMKGEYAAWKRTHKTKRAKSVEPFPEFVARVMTKGQVFLSISEVQRRANKHSWMTKAEDWLKEQGK